MKRKVPLVNGEIYHILSKSIAGFKIFNTQSEYLRMRNIIKHYLFSDGNKRFSYVFSTKTGKKINSRSNTKFAHKAKIYEKTVELIAYCIMPTHLHFVIRQLKDDGISIFMGNALNSYTKYFNTKIKRRGPLWEGRFKNVLVDDDNQLLHLTRYVHLNPVTACLVDKPQDWEFSSFREYTGKRKEEEDICDFQDILEIKPDSYRKFVTDNIAYQRLLAKIKCLVLD